MANREQHSKREKKKPKKNKGKPAPALAASPAGKWQPQQSTAAPKKDA